MKVRLGFVSNSSSSSFCLYGCNIDTTDIETSMLTDEAITLLDSKDFKADENGVYDDPYELVAVLGGGQVCGEEGYIVMGDEPDSMGMDETRGQFEARVRDRVQKYFKDTTKFEWICEDYCC